MPELEEEYREKCPIGLCSSIQPWCTIDLSPAAIGRPCFGQGGKNVHRTGSIQETEMRYSHHSLAFSTTGQRPFQPSRLQRPSVSDRGESNGTHGDECILLGILRSLKYEGVCQDVRRLAH
jgi:hypothetical protein